MTEGEKQTLTGRCLCGEVRYTIEVKAKEAGMCHCITCRRFNGGGPQTMVRAQSIAIDEGDELVWWKSSSWGERGFCGKCGSSMFWRLQREAGSAVVSVGTLDDQQGLELIEHIYIDEKPACYDIADDAPRYTGAEFTAKVLAEMSLPMRLMARAMLGVQKLKSGRAKGEAGPAAQRSARCNCGAVTIKLDEAPQKAMLCQCGQCCRQCGGMGQLYADTSGYEIEGEASLRFYRSSDRGERAFCGICGSKILWRSLDGDITGLCAATLEDGSRLELDKIIYADFAPASFKMAGSAARFPGEG